MLNKLNRNIIFIIVFMAIFVLPIFVNAADCTVAQVRWNKNTVKVGENIQMIVTVQDAGDCVNKNIGVQVFENDSLGVDDSIAGPFVKKFVGTLNTVNYDHVFTVQEWQRGGSENPGVIYFTASVESQDSYKRSSFIFLYSDQAGNGGTTITNFNVNFSQGNLNFTFKVNIPRPGELKSFCGPDPFWVVREINPIKLIRNGQFILDKTSYEFDFSQPGQAANKTFEGVIVCASTQIAQSQSISCNSNGVCRSGGGGGGCGTTGQPACRPGETQTYPFEITNPLKGGANDFASLVKIIAQWIFNLAIPIAVAMIVYAGILFLISGGDTGKVTKARQTLMYAVIGLAIILIGSGFISLIKSILELGSSTP